MFLDDCVLHYRYDLRRRLLQHQRAETDEIVEEATVWPRQVQASLAQLSRVLTRESRHEKNKIDLRSELFKELANGVPSDGPNVAPV